MAARGVLTAILGAAKGVEDVTCPAPVWREEEYLKALFDVLKEGGGGGSSYTLLASQEFEVNTTSTTETIIGTINIPGILDLRNSGEKIILCTVFDKAGKRNGYYFGSITMSTAAKVISGTNYYVKSDGATTNAAYQYGVFMSKINESGVDISSRYVSNFGNLDGTFIVSVYALDFPDNASPFVS